MKTRDLLCLLGWVVYLTTSFGWAANAPLTPSQKIILPPQISSITLNSTSVIGGAQLAGTVTLNQPSPAGGVAVALRSSNPGLAAVPQSVIVQPNAVSANFVVQTQPVAVNPNVVYPNPPSVQIAAQTGNATPMIAQLTVLPPSLTSLTVNPSSVPGGSGSSGTVTISGPAPSAGIVLTLSTGSGSTTGNVVRPPLTAANVFGKNPVTVPQQVTIAVGSTSTSFQITTVAVSAVTTVQIAAAWGVLATKTATLTLMPPGIASFPVSPDTQIGGLSTAGTVNLTAPAPPEGMTVYFSTIGTASGGTTGSFPQCGSHPTMPSTLKIAGGSTSVSVPITTSPGYGTYIAYACLSLPGSCNAPVYTTHNVNVYGFQVIPPLITQNSLVLPSSVKGGTTIQARLQLQGQAMSANCGTQYPLSSSNTNVVQVPPYVTVTPDASQGNFSITTSAVSTAQTVIITVAQSVPAAVFSNTVYNYSAPLMTVQVTLTVTP